MDKKLEAETNAPQFYILFAKSALWMASTSRKKKVEKMMRTTFGSDSDGGELSRYVKRVQDCERFLKE